jgi:hypothetical protein
MINLEAQSVISYKSLITFTVLQGIYSEIKLYFGAATFLYDANGNLTSDGTNSYA